MEDQQDLSRRRFVKGAAATGVAATGVGAFGGQAAAQDPLPANLDIRSVSRSIFRQRGNQQAGGVIVVQVQNVAVDLIDNLTLAFQNVLNNNTIEVLTFEDVDVRVLNNNTVKINVTDFIEVEQNQVQIALTLLGETVQNQDFRGDTTETFNIGQ